MDDPRAKIVIPAAAFNYENEILWCVMLLGLLKIGTDDMVLKGS